MSEMFSRFCVFKRVFRQICILLVVQKQTLGEVGNWMVLWWQVVSGIFTPEIIKIWLNFLEVTIENVGNVFLRHSVVTGAAVAATRNKTELHYRGTLICRTTDHTTTSCCRLSIVVVLVVRLVVCCGLVAHFVVQHFAQVHSKEWSSGYSVFCRYFCFKHTSE